MKTLLGTLCLLLSACTQTGPPTVAIRDVTVVDVTDGSLRADHTVVVAGNRIVAVGPTDEVRIPPDADVIDAAGGYLIPGLWDMHVHSVDNVEAEEADQSIANQDWHLPLFLAHGVTGVRNMNDFTGDVTLELTRTIKRQLVEGSRPGPPRFLSAGPAVDGDPYLGFTKKVSVRTAAEARAVVEQLASNGADLVKVYENVSREVYFAILDEAGRREISVDGHLPFRITPEEAAAAGQRTVEHPEALAAGCSTEADAERERLAAVLADYDGPPGSEKLLVMQIRHYRALYDSRDPAACAPAFESYRHNGVAVTADLLVYHHIVHAEEIISDTARMRLVPEAIRRNWEEMLDSEMYRELQSVLRPIPPLELENVRLANEAGIVLLAATDVDFPMGVPGLSLHEELVRLVEAGLTPLEALRTATLNPARVLGLAESVGTIEVGKLADLVLLDANPLEDIHNTLKIRAVVADGRLYRRADLDRMLETAAELDRQAEEMPASAQAPFPPDSTVQALLRQLVDDHGIKGIVVGSLDEMGTRRVIAYGDPGPGALPLDGESVFEIGSMTKVFTGILLADMVRRSEVELADPLADLLPPDVRVPERNGKPITLLDLTTHFSGLPTMPTNLAPANPENPFADYTMSRMYEFISSYELQRDPGAAFEYSNIAMALLGQALSQRAGTPTYEALVSDRILWPLGMSHTAVALTPWMRDHLVRGHDRTGKPVANWDMVATAGMGGLRSTVNDMLTFAAANLSAASLSSGDADLRSAMRVSHRGLRLVGEGVTYPGIPIAFKEGRVGFNWIISRPGQRRITWTVGLTGGYSSFLGLDIAARRAVVVLTNTGLNNVDYVGFHLLDPTVPMPEARESGGVQ